MTNRDNSTKKQIETSKLNIPREEQDSYKTSSLDNFTMRHATENPNSYLMTPQTVLQLQRTIGNQAVQRLLPKTGIVTTLTPQTPTTSADLIQLSRSGVIIMDGDKFAVRDSDEGVIRVDPGDFRIAVGTAIEYEVEKPNKFFTKAVVVSAGERPEATDIGGEMRKQNEARTSTVQSQGYFNVNKVNLIGRENVSGARKHYQDTDAVARSDKQVYGLLDASKIEVTVIEGLSDTFKIGLGGIYSIVGEIVYTNNKKNAVRAINVFHVGPSLA